MQENNNENNEEIKNIKDDLNESNKEENNKEEQNDILTKQKLIKDNILDKHYNKDSQNELLSHLTSRVFVYKARKRLTDKMP